MKRRIQAADSIRFCVRGRGAQRLLGQAAQAGLKLERIAPQADGFTAVVSGAGWAKLCQLAGAGGWQVIQMQRRGPGPLAERLLRRPGILAGIGLFFVLLHWLGGFLWCMNLELLTVPQQESIRTLLAQSGIWEGCRPSQAELAALDYRSKLDLTENVRIVTIQGCDVCACCAPHVKHTGEIGLVKLLDAMRHRGGIRIWMAAGKMALADYQVKQENIAAISAALSVQQPQAAQGVQRILGEMEGLKEALKAARQALVLEKAKALPEAQGNLCLFEADLDAGSLRALANAGMEKCTGICAVFTGDDQTGYRYVMGSRTVDLRAQAKAINTALGGKGGGQPTMIQGSVTAGHAAILAYFQ